MSLPQCSVISLTDTELTALVECARERLVVIAPGLSKGVAEAVARRWQQLGSGAVQVVLDSDPEVCRMGFGDIAALVLLHRTAEQLGTRIHQQQGLRIGIVVTDETTVIYSPIPLLVEAGGFPGQRSNAVRLDTPILSPRSETPNTHLDSINLEPEPLRASDVQATSDNLAANPPLKFDLARKVRVFNAQFEFVEFELRGLAISRKTVRIPSDLIGLAKEPKAQKRLRSSFQLIEEGSDLSGERVNRLKQFIIGTYLNVLPGYGTVVLRSKKEDFQAALNTLDRYVQRFQRRLLKRLQKAIDANREMLVSALLPGVAASPPSRWKRQLGTSPCVAEIEQSLRSELSEAFGSAADLCNKMVVNAVFKGVTYELLSDPDFVRVARKKMKRLNSLHDEFDTASSV